MIRKGLLVLICLVCYCSEADSQHLSPQVMVSAAGTASSGGVVISQTIGEAAVTTITAYDFTLTQGFQQPVIKFKPDSVKNGNGVNVYPNPAISYLYIDLFGDEARSFNITVINISGKIVITEEIHFSDRYSEIIELSFAHLSRGSYFVRVTSTDKVINRTFIIEKM